MHPQVPQQNVTGQPVGTFVQSKTAIDQIKSSLLLFTALGVGLGIVGSILSSSSDMLGPNVAMITIIPIALVTPIVGIVPGYQIGSRDLDAQPIAVYALVIIAASGGAIIQFMIASVLTAVNTTGTSVPDLFVFSFVVAVGTSIAGLGSAFMVRNHD